MKQNQSHIFQQIVRRQGQEVQVTSSSSFHFSSHHSTTNPPALDLNPQNAKNKLFMDQYDYKQLNSIKKAFHQLESHYLEQSKGIVLDSRDSEKLASRFSTIKGQIEDLLERRVDFSTKYNVFGTRNLDLDQLVKEKQNKITELEKKIQNLNIRLSQSLITKEKLLLKIDELTNKIPNEPKYQLVQQQDSQFYNELVSVKTQKWLKQATLNEQLNLQIRKAFLQILQKYPHIKTSIDQRIITFVSSASTYGYSVSANGELGYTNIDAMAEILDEVSLNRLVQIVKYVPETIKVQNVYTYSSSKTKKVEFYLRVLIKALLEQIEKMKAKFGAVLYLDQGVIGMIKEEVLDIVNVDDILKIFRVKEKIVEVQRVVEKLVEKIVEVPKVVQIQKIVQIPVQNTKIVEKVIHKPVEVIKVVDKIIEKFVEVPTIEEKIVQVPTITQVVVNTQKQVPKIVQVQKIVKEVVVNTNYVQVEKPVNHIITEIQVVQIIKEVPIFKETVREVIKEVELIVEKIVLQEVERVQIVEVEKIVQKVIIEKEYVPTPCTELVVMENIKEVPVYIEKIVPVEKIITKYVQVPKRIEVPVIVKQIVPEVQIVEIYVEKVIEKIVPKEIQIVKNVIVEKVVEVIKVVEKRIEVPIIQDRIVRVPIEVPKIVVERVHVPHIIPIKCIEEKIVQQPVIIQVEKPVIQYVKDIQVVNCYIDKIIQIPVIQEKLKEIKITVEKIVNKIVEVPKVVEVEKIVEKIVVVPRVIEKIVQVPQLIQIMVEKIVEVPKVQIVEKIIEKIVQKEKIVQVQRIVNFIQQVKETVQKIREIPVITQTVIEKKEVVEIPVERIITLNKEVPVQIIVDNIVEKIVECTKVVPLESQELFVVQVPKIVDRVIQKPIEIRSTFVEQKQVHVPVQILTKNEVVETKVLAVDKIIEKAVAVVEPKIITQTKVVLNQKFTVVPQITKCPVLVYEKVYCQPTIVEKIREKPVQVIIEINKEKPVNIGYGVPIEVYKVVELTRDSCHIATQHKIVTQTVEKIVPVRTYEQYAVQKECTVQKIVGVSTTKTEIKPEVIIERQIVEKQNITVLEDKVPYPVTEVQVIQLEGTKLPVYLNHDKIVAVPTFQEKIYQRIIVMPQVVEVIKHITQICETQNTLIAGIHVDIIEEERRYRELYQASKTQLLILVAQFKIMKDSNPNLRSMIEIVEKLLLDFDLLASVRKIVPVEKIKIVEKEVPKPIIVPTQDSQTIKNQLAYTLLIQKLILELKRITKENSRIKLQLDADVNLFFFNQPNLNIQSSAWDFQQSFKRYTQQAILKLKSQAGDWTHKHQLMLSTILAERFNMANHIKQSTSTISKLQNKLLAVDDTLLNIKNRWLLVQKMLKSKTQSLSLLQQDNTHIDYLELISFIEECERTVTEQVATFESIRFIESVYVIGSDLKLDMMTSRVRELELTIIKLTEELVGSSKCGHAIQVEQLLRERTSLNEENEELAKKNSILISKIEQLERQIRSHACPSKVEFEITINKQIVQIEEYKTQINRLDITINQHNLTIKTLNNTNQQLQIRISQLQAQLRQAQNSSVLANSLKKANDQISRLTRAKQDVEIQLKGQKVVTQQYIKIIDKITIEIRQLKQLQPKKSIQPTTTSTKQENTNNSKIQGILQFLLNQGQKLSGITSSNSKKDSNEASSISVKTTTQKYGYQYDSRNQRTTLPQDYNSYASLSQASSQYRSGVSSVINPITSYTTPQRVNPSYSQFSSVGYQGGFQSRYQTASSKVTGITGVTGSQISKTSSITSSNIKDQKK